MASRCLSSYLKVDGIWAKCLSAGAPPVELTKPIKVILVIPGNPGLSEFYDTFMYKLKANLDADDKRPIWCLGHAGVDAVDDGEGKNPVPMETDVSNLTRQISQKVDFLKKYVSIGGEGCEVTMIGHSVGVFIALKIMERLQKVSKANFKVYGLFPMIERMYQTPSGPKTWIQTAYLARIMVALVWCLDYIMPLTCRKCVASFLADTRDEGCLNAVRDLMNATRVFHVLNMAYTELTDVKELDYDFLKANADKIRLYYGANDNWCPNEFYHDLKRKIPEIKSEMCMAKLPHSFVLKYSSYVAKMVADWFLEDGKENKI